MKILFCWNCLHKVWIPVIVFPVTNMLFTGRLPEDSSFTLRARAKAYLRTKRAPRLRLGLAKVSGIALRCSRSGTALALIHFDALSLFPAVHTEVLTIRRCRMLRTSSIGSLPLSAHQGPAFANSPSSQMNHPPEACVLAKK